MERLRTRISDGRLLDLIQRWLKQDIVSECARWTPTGGTPQGAVVSPLLGLHRGERLDPASGQDSCRGLPDHRAGVRVPGISFRGGTPARAEEEHAAPAGQDQSEDATDERT